MRLFTRVKLIIPVLHQRQTWIHSEKKHERRVRTLNKILYDWLNCNLCNNLLMYNLASTNCIEICNHVKINHILTCCTGQQNQMTKWLSSNLVLVTRAPTPRVANPSQNLPIWHFRHWMHIYICILFLKRIFMFQWSMNI